MSFLESLIQETNTKLKELADIMEKKDNEEEKRRNSEILIKKEKKEKKELTKALEIKEKEEARAQNKTLIEKISNLEKSAEEKDKKIEALEKSRANLEPKEDKEIRERNEKLSQCNQKSKVVEIKNQVILPVRKNSIFQEEKEEEKREIKSLNSKLNQLNNRISQGKNGSKSSRYDYSFSTIFPFFLFISFL